MRCNVLITGLGVLPYGVNVKEVKLCLSDGYPLTLQLDMCQNIFRTDDSFTVLANESILLSPYEEEHLAGAALRDVLVEDCTGVHTLSDFDLEICSVSLIDNDRVSGVNVVEIKSFPPLGAKDFKAGDIKLVTPEVGENGDIEFEAELWMSSNDVLKKFGVSVKDESAWVNAYLYYDPKEGDVWMKCYLSTGTTDDADFDMELSVDEKMWFKQQCENFSYPHGWTALEFAS